MTSDSGMASISLASMPDTSPNVATTTAPVTPSAMGTPPNASTPSANTRDALKHVLDNVLCLPHTSGLRQSLQNAGFVKIQQVVSMSTTTMKALSYKTKVASTVVNMGLLLSEEETLMALQGFARFHIARLGRPLSADDWCSFSEEEFDEYQGSYHANCIATPPPMTPVGTPFMPLPNPMAPPSVPPPLSEVAAFRRGI